jgi:glycerophosphoryl diester phosphodiesterase
VHDVGGRVIAWTVNRPEQALALATMGVDGLCTDFLPVLRAAL